MTGETESTIGDFIPDEKQHDIYSDIISTIDAEKLLSILTQQEQMIIILRHGLRGEYGHTLEEVAEIIGNISREGIRLIEIEAFQKMKSHVNSQFLLE